MLKGTHRKIKKRGIKACCATYKFGSTFFTLFRITYK